MTKVQWDQTGEKRYESGVDHGVLYQLSSEGKYVDGEAWNGLTTVTESPSGAESNPQYADNIKYVDLTSAEEFGGTIEAFTYPDSFGINDGTVSPVNGVRFGQQGRRPFGLCYRTLIGDDVEGTDAGYKLHLVYGAKAAPSEKAYATINDSPEATAFSWEFTTTPVPVDGFKPVASLEVDSTKTDADRLAELEDILFGTDSVDPRLPLPDEVVALLEDADGSDEVRLTGANAPSFNNSTNVLTLPNVSGVQWRLNGNNTAPGAKAALQAGQSHVVTAVAQPGFRIVGDDDWTYDFVA